MSPSQQITLAVAAVFLLYTTSTATVLSVQSPCQNNFFYDAVYDLQANSVCPSRHVTEYKPVVKGTKCECCTRGTLNITMNNSNRSALLVDLWFKPSLMKKFAFNLGDSHTNNGWKGDSRSTSYDAEIHNRGKESLSIFSSDVGAAAGEPREHRVIKAFSRRLTLVIQAGQVQWVSESTMDFLKQKGLFHFNGPNDREARGNADYNVYLGLNQVVNGLSSRRGYGLCKAAVRFLCDRKEEKPTKPSKEATPVKPDIKGTPVRPVRPTGRRGRKLF